MKIKYILCKSFTNETLTFSMYGLHSFSDGITSAVTSKQSSEMRKKINKNVEMKCCKKYLFNLLV